MEAVRGRHPFRTEQQGAALTGNVYGDITVEHPVTAGMNSTGFSKL